MHGRVKLRTTEEQQEIKRLERLKRLKCYRAGISKALEKRQNAEYDEEGLDITAQLLSANPDIYTLWNFRREILQELKGKISTEDFQLSMVKELQLTQQCLKGNPKSYGSWHHRDWVLDHMPTPDFAQELAMCNKYLELDERNFHVWDHRRLVVAKSAVSAADELAYSTSKIATNFSNYSSWHYRSQLLPTVYPDPMEKRPIREEEHKQELELVQNACFTDPADSSAWFYQRWLLGRAPSPQSLISVSVSQGAVVVALTRPADLRKNVVEITFDGQPLGGTWQATTCDNLHHVWSYVPAGTLLPCGLLAVEVAGDRAAVTLVNGEGRWRRAAQFDAQLSDGLRAAFEQELDNCRQLLEMEPESKWTMINTVLLMQAIDRQKYKEATMETIKELLKVDPLRSAYYKDLRSKYLMEYAIEAMQTQSSSELDLSGVGLTALYHTEHLCGVHTAKLSGNHLSNSLHKLAALQACHSLDLSGNGIGNLAGMPALPNLRTLDLSGNRICSVDDLKAVEQYGQLERLKLQGNPYEGNYDLPSGRRILSGIDNAPEEN